MAINAKNLGVLAYANAFTLWIYKESPRGGTPLALLAEIRSEGHFDPAADMLAPGDMIMVAAPDGGMILVVQQATGVGPVIVQPMISA